MEINTKNDFIKTSERAIKDGPFSPYGTLWNRAAHDYIMRTNDPDIITDCTGKMNNQYLDFKIRVDWVVEYLKIKDIE